MVPLAKIEDHGLDQTRTAHAITDAICRLADQGHMKHVPTEQVINAVGWVALAGQDIVGYIRVKSEAVFIEPEKHGSTRWQEVGSLWVPDPWKGQKISEKLIASATAFLLPKHIQPFAICRNAQSTRAFRQEGYIPGLAPDDRPCLTRPLVQITAKSYDMMLTA